MYCKSILDILLLKIITDLDVKFTYNHEYWNRRIRIIILNLQENVK